MALEEFELISVSANPKNNAWSCLEQILATSRVCRPDCWPGLGRRTRCGAQVNISPMMEGSVCTLQQLSTKTIGVRGPDRWLGSGLGSQQGVRETHSTRCTTVVPEPHVPNKHQVVLWYFDCEKSRAALCCSTLMHRGHPELPWPSSPRAEWT